MDDWKKFHEKSLPEKEKEEFYGNLNMEDITDLNYNHAKKDFKGFEIKNLGGYYNLYLRSDILSEADVFENLYLEKMCVEIYELHSSRFLSTLVLVYQADLKRTKVKLESLIDIGMLLMVGKRTRGELCHSINRYAKANNKYMKDYDKKGIFISYILGFKNLYG